MKNGQIDLGLPGETSEHRVVVAMSGGVDSSVTAALVTEAGYDVIGVTLQLYDHGESINRKGTCCAGADIQDARAVADQLGIPHYVLNYESRFREAVIDDFADSYLRGETPIPCVRCNQTVKFTDLVETARQLGAQALCTGHYVQRLIGENGVELHKGIDPHKDQSYFMFTTTKEQLEYLRFPVGDLTKEETRAHAYRLGLSVAEKPDSQDICFVPGGKYADVVSRLRPGAVDPGEIVSLDGDILGYHDGIINFTVGQRKGLGIGGRIESDNSGLSTPLYVIAIDPNNKRVVVGPKSTLGRNIVKIQDINWLGWKNVGSSCKVMVKLRSSHKPIPAVLYKEKRKAGRLVLEEKEYGLSIGQAAVFYSYKEQTRIIGGGWITDTSIA
ncbi:MAG: tRNA 2-thiouridine(34) synthase MnmA [Rhodospirillaceae bacterium]|nr:tRNA 2-thiouridine(34) synthase MnmA [Rhodospirillaceae bacterium]